MKDTKKDRHKSLLTVYNDPTFPEFGRPCDTHLKADDGTEFKVYSKLLSNRSEFFKSLFSYDEAVGHSVVIHGIGSNILEKVLIYLYTRYIDLNTKNMMDLFVASDFLLIKPLKLKCRKFVVENFNEENCVKIFLRAHRIKDLDLLKKCCGFILHICENFPRISKKNKGYNHLRKSMKYFLSNKSINVLEEKIIWSFIDGRFCWRDDSNRYTSIYAIYNNPAFSEFGRPCDTHLKTDDGAEFKVYSKYLSKYSEFLKSLFSCHEEIGQCVVIHGIKSDVLDKVLIYLHTRHVSINIENMFDLLVASDFLLIEPLLLECRRFILQRMNEENCVNFYLRAYGIRELELEQRCSRILLFCFEKAVKFSRNKAYDLPYDSVKYLLSNRSLNVSGERVVWSFLEGWVKRDKSNRLPLVPQLLRYLCINDINDKLASSIINSPIIRQNKLYKDLGDPQVTLHPLNDKQKAEKIIGYHRNDTSSSPANRLPRSVYFVTKASLENSLVELFISYDHHLDLWRRLGQKTFHLHTLLKVGHRVYVFKSYKYAPKFIEEACVYDLSTNVDLSMAELPNTPDNPLSFLVVEASGQIYALQVSYTPATFQRYVDATDEWTSLAPMPEPIIIPTAAVTLNGLVYVIGQTEMRVYDPSTNAWKTVSPPNKERMDMAAAAYRGKIFLVGGVDEDQSMKDVEVYDPVDDEWSVGPDVPFGSSVIDSGLAVVKGRLFVYRKSPPYSTAFWDGSGEWALVKEGSPLVHMCRYSFCEIEGREAVGEIVEMNRAVDAWRWIETGLGKEVLLKSND